MAEFALLIVRWGFRVAIATAAITFLLIYPYIGEVRTQANSIANQIAQTGYFDADYRQIFLDKLNGNRGMIGNSTLTPNDPEVSRLMIGFGPPNEVKIEACYHNSGTVPATCTPMIPITKDQRNGYVTAAETSGTAPNGALVLDRDTAFTVKVKTNFKMSVIFFGRELVAYLPMEQESVMITRKDYRW